MAIIDLDLPSILKSLGGDQQLLRETFKLTLRILPKQMEQLKAAVELKQGNAIELAAHTVKGSLVIFHHRRLIDEAFEIERAGKSGAIENVDVLMTSLESDIKQLLMEIEKVLQD